MMKITTSLTTTLAAIVLCQCTPYHPQSSSIDGIADRSLGDAPGGTTAVNGEFPDGTSNPATATPPADDYPLARRTSRPTHVISPYPPHIVIDVRDFKSGDLARDPGNQKIFRVP